ncbi:hypothetical protein QQX98_007284 [Neonectria punicea]|uniref:Uncharacterized protein n=1 Tax=Neonectria punicea TaxID=979145 RepID=A0ABR1GZ32_9HYPO
MSFASTKAFRATRALQPTIAARLPVAQRGFHVSRTVRQGASPGAKPPGSSDPAQQNRYLMYGAGAVGLGVIFFYMTGKPETAKDVPATPT